MKKVVYFDHALNPGVCIKLTCRVCEEEFETHLPTKDFEAWKNGTLIQDAFPYMDANRRELFISGICGECFDTVMFDPDEEEEEEVSTWEGEGGS